MPANPTIKINPHNPNNPHSYASYLLANHCMPTLLHAKPANLITIHKAKLLSRDSFLISMEQLVSLFSCRSYIIYENDIVILLFIYHVERLIRTLDKPEHLSFLSSFGYSIREDRISAVLLRMQQRYKQYKEKGEDFPHEIGILLGYPYPDVVDFIRFKGENYIMSGCWKVYHNGESTAKLFAYYRSLRVRALELLALGKDLTKIIDN